MLNWMSAVSGAVSNLPSAPTKTVLDTGLTVGLCAIERALRTRTAQNVTMALFIGFLPGSLMDLDPCTKVHKRKPNLKLPLYTSAVRTRRASRVAIERSKARKLRDKRARYERRRDPRVYRQRRGQNKTRQMRTRHILAGTRYLPQNTHPCGDRLA